VANRRGNQAFSLLEVLVSLVIIGILVGLLVPSLIFARDSARTALCAGNLRQIGVAWQQYLHDFDRFPSYTEIPEWRYGGVVFAGGEHGPVMAADRPINRYITEDERSGAEGITALFRCPSDRGIFRLGRGSRPGEPVLANADTCYAAFGTSYKANKYLLDARFAGIDQHSPRGLRPDEVVVSPTRLLVLGDPEWYYATRPANDPDAALDAGWHKVPAGGNFMALDGSIKFHRFEEADAGMNGSVTLHPRPPRS
jgi:prepilin-type N-terminal cleavage/methylation domain-containing protein